MTADRHAERKVYCDNCGEYIGTYSGPREPFESCGEMECERAARDAYAMDREERRWRAEQDDYERY